MAGLAVKTYAVRLAIFSWLPGGRYSPLGESACQGRRGVLFCKPSPRLGSTLPRAGGCRHYFRGAKNEQLKHETKCEQFELLSTACQCNCHGVRRDWFDGSAVDLSATAAALHDVHDRKNEPAAAARGLFGNQYSRLPTCFGSGRTGWSVFGLEDYSCLVGGSVRTRTGSRLRAIGQNRSNYRDIDDICGAASARQVHHRTTRPLD